MKSFSQSQIFLSLFFALLCTLFSLDVHAQSDKVTISRRHVTVKTVLNDIESQTHYLFIYGQEVNVSRKVTVNVKNQPVSKVLHQLFSGQSVKYSTKGDHIVLSVVSAKSSLEVGQGTRAGSSSGKIVKASGLVLDAEGEPIIGATIKRPGASTGTITDVDGHFTIDVPEGSTLQISYIGYEDREVKASENMSITLKSDVEDLNEVVVIGYGTQKKSDLTGSVVSVSEGNFTEGVTTNAFQMINGKAAGVNISQTNSAPGSSTKIQIRGAGSINSSNSALVVVDGLPGVDPSSINSNDIKSIEVLKDASAAAIYGTRAANGVVLITTKSGAKGRLTVKFGAEMGLQSVEKKLDVLNAKQYMETLNAIRLESGNTDGAIFTQDQINAAGEGTNWQDEVFRNGAPVQTYRIGFSGGGDKHTFYVGLGLMDQKGIVKRSGLKKYNVRANINLEPTSFLRFKFNMNFTRNDVNAIYNNSDGVNENAGVINSAVQFDPTLPKDRDSSTGRYYTNSYISLDNPLALLNGIDQDNHTNNFYGTFVTELEPIKDLVFTARVGTTLDSYMNNYYRTRETINGLSAGGVGSKTSGDNTQWLLEFLANYKKSFNHVHDFSILLGATYEQFLEQYVYGKGQGFLSDVLLYNSLQSGDTVNGDDVSSNKSRNRLNGFLGRFNYNYKERYLLTASFRYDGTSRFSDQHKYAFFPSLALAWRITEEPFMKKFSSLSQLKLRVGYGQLGNQGISNYQTLKTLVSGGSAVFGNTLEQGVVLARLQNTNLKWETTEESNIGIDFGFLNNRISGTIDLYSRDTKNQLFNKPLPSSIGFSSIKVNAGKVRNSGVDFTLNTVNIENAHFHWDTSLNFSYLRNKVIDLPDYMPQLITGYIASFVSNYNITRVGDPIYSFYGYKVEGVFQTNDDIAHSAQPNAKPGYLKFHDENGDGHISPEDKVILGKPFPDITFGLTNTLRYKGLTLSVFLQGVSGISTLDVNVLEALYPTNEYRNRLAKYYLNRWTTSHPTNKYPSGVNSSEYGGQYSVNSLTVADASFFRIKNISLTYDIPLKNKNIFQAAQVYAAVDNLATFTSYDGFDPDASATGSTSVSKVNYNSYPLARTFRFGVNLTF